MSAGTKTEAETVAAIVEARPRVVELTEKSVIVVPTQGGGSQVLPARDFLKPYDERPQRRQGTAVLDSLESFVSHVERFKSPESALFADAKGPSLVAVLDYHEPGAELPGFTRARFGTHRSKYRFPLSEEWQAWSSPNLRSGLSQDAFAAFLESRIIDVIAPDKAGESISTLIEQLAVKPATPSRVLEVSRGLTIRQNSKVENHVVLNTGEVQFQYSTEHTDEKGQPIKVPGAFLLGIPVFEQGDLFQVLVRLRYRVIDRAVKWFIEPHDMKTVFDSAFKTACEEARDETTLPLFYGSPE